MATKAQVLGMMNICRFCFSETNLTRIYHKKDRYSVPLPLQIMACLALEVFPNDGMPQFICVNCKEQTRQCYVFKNNCKKAHEALKQFLQSNDNEIVQPNLTRLAQLNKATPKNFKVVAKGRDGLSWKEKNKKYSATQVILEVPIPRNEELDEPQQTTLVDKHGNSEDFDVTAPNRVEPELQSLVNQSDDGEYNIEEIDLCSMFPCPCCIRTFTDEDDLNIHLSKLHPSEKPYPCDLCTKKFYTAGELKIHQQIHSGRFFDAYKCNICQKTVPKNMFNRHLQVEHKPDLYSSCSKCGEVFTSSYELEDHTFVKHQANENYSCTICNKTFVFKQGLTRHMELHHTTSLRFGIKCQYCEKTFANAIQEARHLADHEELRPYQCKVCKRSFTVFHHLTRHNKIHSAIESGAPPEKVIYKHKCDLCSMSFRDQADLLEHSIVHSIVNVTCVICNVEYTSSSEVREHIKTHMEHLQYPCEKCNYSFVCKEHLVAHMVKHAQLEYEEKIEEKLLEECRRSPSPPLSPVKPKRKTTNEPQQLGTPRKKPNRPSRPQTEPPQPPPQKSPTASPKFHSQKSPNEMGLIPRIIETQSDTGEVVYTLNLNDENMSIEYHNPRFEEEAYDMMDQTTGQQFEQFQPEVQDPLGSECQAEAQQEQEDDEPMDAIDFGPNPHSEQMHFETDYQQTSENIMSPYLPQSEQQNPRHSDKEPEQQNPEYRQQLEYQNVQAEMVDYDSQQLFKSEVESEDEGEQSCVEDQEIQEHQNISSEETLKPIVRNERTKMYARKNLDRKLPQIESAIVEIPNVASPEEINDSSSSMPLPLLDLNQENIPIATPLRTNLEKIGDKVVRVQKYIMTMDEIKRLQKQGLIEVRGGKVVLKSKNNSILDASIKPVQKDDIDNFIKSTPRSQVRRYQRPARITELEANILENAASFMPHI